MATDAKSVRQRIQEIGLPMMEEEFDHHGSVRVPLIAHRVWAELSEDAGATGRFWEEQGAVVCLNVLQEIVRDRRDRAKRFQPSTADTDTTVAVVDETPPEFWSIAMDGKQFPLLRMGKSELQTIVNSRQLRLTTEMTDHRLHRHLLMTIGEDDVVGDHYSLDDLRTLRADIEAQTTEEMKKSWAYSPRKIRVFTPPITPKSGSKTASLEASPRTRS